MSRRELREQIFKLLFRVEFNHKDDMPEQIQLFFQQEDEPISEKKQVEITQKYEKITECLEEIDEIIEQTSTGWTIARMGKVDLAILRLAVYEMKKDEDIPVSVAINEAVELAKKFGQDESPSFINGVLAKLAK